MAADIINKNLLSITKKEKQPGKRLPDLILTVMEGSDAQPFPERHLTDDPSCDSRCLLWGDGANLEELWPTNPWPRPMTG